jgi:hypothetical protein
MKTYEDFKTMAAGLTEAEGFRLLHATMSHFGWAGTVFCRGDAEARWQEMVGTDDPMPDDVWEKVQNDYAWRHMDEMLSETGNETLGLIIEDLLGEQL